MANFKNLILGTHNAKKAGELRHMLEPLGFTVQTLAEIPNAIDVVEDGSTFAENAALKATKQAVHLNAWVIGEDSGLCVDALNGEPGIFSARYATLESDSNASDDANNQRLLRELADTPLGKRTAHYISHIAISDPSGNVRANCESKCCGRIGMQPTGGGGFGYDPLFEIIELHKTFGELGPNVKSMISHRARALRMFVRMLRSIKAD